MNDPWHAETLEQLVAFLRSRAPVRFAVLTTTSAELEEEVLGELRAELEDFRWHELPLGADEDALERFVEWLSGAEDERRLVLVQGLRERVEAEGNARIEVLGAFNLQRETLAARGEAIVFLTDEASAAELGRQAPDLYRFTIGFDFERVDDWIARGEAEEAREIPEPVGGGLPEDFYIRRVERARAEENPRRIAKALITLAGREWPQGKIEDAYGHAAEALDLARQIEDPELLIEALVLWSRVLRWRGGLDEAIATAQEAWTRTAETSRGSAYENAIRDAWTNSLMTAGRFRDALEVVEKALETRMEPEWKATMEIERAQLLSLLGRPDESVRILEEIHRPVPSHLRKELFLQCARLYRRVGDLRSASEAVGKHLAHSKSRELRAYDSARLLWRHGEIRPARERLNSVTIEVEVRKRHRRGLSWLSASVDFDLKVDAKAVTGEAEKCLKICRADGSSDWLSAALLLAAEIDAWAGSLSVALERAEEARNRLETTSSYLLPDFDQTLARLNRLAGHLDRAHDLAEAAARRAHEQGTRPIVARADTERAMIALARGDAEAARQHAEAALACIRETRFRRDEPAALAARAAARRLAGDDDAADERRWCRLVHGMGARGLKRRIEQSLAASAAARE